MLAKIIVTYVGADQFEALEKLRKHRVLLEKVMTLDLTFLAHEMNAVGLLPDYTHKDVTDPRSMLTKAQKATSMVSSLEIKVEINQHNLDKFVRILENKPQLFGDIINYLSPPGQGEYIVEVRSLYPVKHMHTKCLVMHLI